MYCCVYHTAVLYSSRSSSIVTGEDDIFSRATILPAVGADSAHSPFTHRSKQTLQHVDVSVSPAAPSGSLAVVEEVVVVVPTSRITEPRPAAVQKETLPMAVLLRLLLLLLLVLLRDECYDWMAMVGVGSGGDGGGAVKARDARRHQSGACDSQQPAGEAHYHPAH